ncbi:MAG: hypothetical protein QGG64_05810, partial [Candidatus Latescibacteria bacterium]|nr:hypothetical protein [Candidatus Latescibacterota bacterium]
DGHQWKSYTKPQLPVERVRIFDLVETSAGAIWLIFSGGAPVKVEYGTNRWTTFAGLNFQCEDANGSLWFTSSDSGVVVNKKGIWTRYDIHDGLMQAPRTLIATRNGIWAGGSHNQVATTARFNGQTWHRTHHPKLSWNIAPNGMYEAADGTIWVGADVDRLLQLGQKGGVICYRHLKHPASRCKTSLMKLPSSQKPPKKAN